MAAATTKAMTVRVRANSRSHPKTPTRRAKTEGAFQCLHTCFADSQHKKEFSHRSSRDRHMSSLFLHPSPPCGDACPGRQPVLKFEADKLEKERKVKGEQDRGAKDEAPAKEEEEGAPASKRKSRKGKGGGGGTAPTSPLPSAPSLRPSVLIQLQHIALPADVGDQPPLPHAEGVGDGDKDGHDVVPSRLRQGQLLAVLSDVRGRERREGEAEEGRGEEVEDEVEGGWGDRGEGRGGRRGGEKGERREGLFHWLRRRGKRGERSGIKEGEEDVGRGVVHPAGTTVQGEGVDGLSIPAGDTDVIVDGDVHRGVKV